MHEINNKVAVDRVSNNLRKANRTRNLFTMIAIILTTFMISEVFSIGISVIKNYQIYAKRTIGTEAFLFLEHPTKDQYEQIAKLSYIKAAGVQITAGTVHGKTKEEKDLKISMVYYDDEEWEQHYKPAISEIKGKYPAKADEIMMSNEALKLLNLSEAKIGDRIQLEYIADGNTQTEEFQLIGTFRNYERFSSSGIGMIMMSLEFCNNNNLSLTKDGVVCISAPKGEQEAVHDQFVKDITWTEEQTINSYYDNTTQNTSSTWGAIAVIVMLALFLVFSGYLLIYNIMYISISKDIRFYGLLKTLGTSPKQLRRIVRKQAYTLSGIGIPVGLLLGAVASFFVVPMAMRLMQSGDGNSIFPGTVSFHPIIFIGTALFAFLTVAVSLRKPAKLAGEVSPIEALKYNEVDRDGKRGSKEKKVERHTTKGGKLYRMAWYNVFRDRKRAWLVFASLFLGIITLIGISSFLGSIQLENYLKSYVPHSFSYQNYTQTNEGMFDDTFLESLRDIDGIDRIEVIPSVYANVVFDRKMLLPLVKQDLMRYQGNVDDNLLDTVMETLEETKDYGTYLYAIDDAYVIEYNKIHDNKINLKEFQEGRAALLAAPSRNEDKDLLIGKTLNLYTKGNSNIIGLPISGYMDTELCNYGNNAAHMVGAPPAIYVSTKFLDILSKEQVVSYITLDASEEMEASVGTALSKLNETLVNKSFFYRSRVEVKQEFQNTMLTMKVLSNGISLLLITIGILNFINVMLTGVNARKKEFAVMESLGTTKSQIMRMLQFEGIYYAMITVGLIMTIGNIFLYAISSMVKSVVDYAVFEYPIGLIGMMLVSLSVICLLLPSLVYKTVSKDSVTNRLRMNEG